jgi:hypothetical protein
MGRKKNEDSDGLPPEPKPKKLFKMEFIIWDDGEITRDLIEQKYGERGAPKGWRVDPSDFVRSVASVIGDQKHLLDALLKSLDISEEQLRIAFLKKDKAAQQASAIGSAMKSAQSEDPTESDLEFDEK